LFRLFAESLSSRLKIGYNRTNYFEEAAVDGSIVIPVKTGKRCEFLAPQVDYIKKMKRRRLQKKYRTQKVHIFDLSTSKHYQQH
jgi:hypothetical protein